MAGTALQQVHCISRRNNARPPEGSPRLLSPGERAPPSSVRGVVCEATVVLPPTNVFRLVRALRRQNNLRLFFCIAPTGNVPKWHSGGWAVSACLPQARLDRGSFYSYRLGRLLAQDNIPLLTPLSLGGVNNLHEDQQPRGGEDNGWYRPSLRVGSTFSLASLCSSWFRASYSSPRPYIHPCNFIIHASIHRFRVI